jgi:mannose-1-phosphate guanylyltransferase
MLVFLILAGGRGERLWPLSTKNQPKQFLSLYDDKSLLRHTFERALMLTEAENVFISTNKIQRNKVRQELPELPQDHIIVEPEFKGTAAAVEYASDVIHSFYPNPIIVVAPSDQYIGDPAAFTESIQKAVKKAEEDAIVTLGIMPTYPATGFGYIQVEERGVSDASKVTSFVEKPSLDVAKRYLAEQRYFWNAGLFVFSYQTMQKAFQTYTPENFAIFSQMSHAKSSQEKRQRFHTLVAGSIDVLVMQRANNIYVVPSNCGWSDVGSYSALYELLPKDADQNVSRNVLFASIDSHNNLLISDKRKANLFLIGIHDQIIVFSQGNILICDRQKQDLIPSLIESQLQKK